MKTMLTLAVIAGAVYLGCWTATHLEEAPFILPVMLFLAGIAAIGKELH